jgi:hypothetical protein
MIPRRVRSDAIEILYYLIVRRIERRLIVYDMTNRRDSTGRSTEFAVSATVEITHRSMY